MIQRIQTVYLFICILLLTWMFWSPYAEVFYISKQFNLKVWLLTLTGINNSYPAVKLISFSETLPFQIVNILVLLFAIFSYSKRKRQRFLCLLAMIVNINMAFLMHMNIHEISKNYDNHVVDVHYLYPAVFPIVMLVLIVLAERAIRKDEKLVRSLDRIR